MKFQPSSYQIAIEKALNETTSNLVIDAKAGSGKTSTLKMLCANIPLNKQVDPKFKILNLAFNKAIVQELLEKLPSFVEVKTLHGKGFEILKTKGCKLDDKGEKAREILKRLCREWGINGDDDEGKEFVSNMKQMGELCRMNLALTLPAIQEVADRHGIVPVFGDENEKVLHYLRVMASNRAIVDFTDMIFLPAIFDDYTFPKYDLIFVDECQDLSVAQQKLMLKMLKPEGRFVAVGDPGQAIYAFMGADSSAFQKLTEIPNTITMPLNECYRCGKNIVKFAQSIVPEITAFAGNGDGEVIHEGKVDDIRDGDMVLCRMTMPLVVLCYKFISEGKAAFVRGRDIGAGLVSLVQKSRRNDLKGVEKFLETELEKLFQKLAKLNPSMTPKEVAEKSAYVNLEEKVKILKLIIANNGTVVNAPTLCQKIDSIFKDTKNGGICLSTIHKSKGLEADRVFIIEADLMPSPYAKKAWEMQQEKNLQYVAYTRAKRLLSFVSDWSSKDERRNEIEAKKEKVTIVPLKDLPF